MPLYRIERRISDTEWRLYDRRFMTRERAKDWTAGRLNTYRTVQEPDPNWRIREAGRLTDGTYQRFEGAWAELGSIADHYAHVAADEVSVAFTVDEAKGQADVQAVMRPGRYLAKYYPELRDVEREALATAFGQPPELAFATCADDIEAVYRGGPASCMSHGLRAYDSAVHPVRVFGDSDLQVAYLGDLHDASARALVRPATMAYVSIYGDYARLGRALRAAGYQQNDRAFEGARLRVIEDNPGQWVMPYLDGVQRVGFAPGEPGWWVIGGGDGGEFWAWGQNGLVDHGEDCSCGWHHDDEADPDDDAWDDPDDDDYDDDPSADDYATPPANNLVEAN